MRKKTIIIALIAAAIIFAIIVVKRNYSLSPEYNYITAKLDIRSGNCRIVNVGTHIASANDSAIQSIALKYMFTNVYIENPTPNVRKGINNYNETIDIYLAIRNGADWKARYQTEVDSILMKSVPTSGKK